GASRIRRTGLAREEKMYSTGPERPFTSHRQSSVHFSPAPPTRSPAPPTRSPTPPTRSPARPPAPHHHGPRVSPHPCYPYPRSVSITTVHSDLPTAVHDAV